jgi:hypothetical protein
MSDCKTVSTPVDTKSKLSSSTGTAVSDPTFYRSIIGALQYLTLMRLDLSYAMQQACLHMHDPRDVHWTFVKLVLHYIRGTSTKRLQLWRSTPPRLVVYADADWAGCLNTRRSTTCFCVFLGDSLVS